MLRLSSLSELMTYLTAPMPVRSFSTFVAVLGGAVVLAVAHSFLAAILSSLFFVLLTRVFLFAISRVLPEGGI